MASPTLCQLYPHKFVPYCAPSDERVPTSVGAEVIVVARQDLPRAAAARLSTEHGPRVGAGAELSTMSTLTGARRRRADVRARPRAPAAVDCTTDRWCSGKIFCLESASQIRTLPSPAPCSFVPLLSTPSLSPPPFPHSLTS